LESNLKYTTVCITCGKEFTKQISIKRYNNGIVPKYCSNECLSNKSKDNTQHRKVNEKTCPICNEKFYPKDKRQKYCSLRCFGIDKSRKVVYKHCLFCGKPFKIGKHKDQKYCSQECFYNSKKRDNTQLTGIFNCEQCGKEYTLPRTGKDKYIPENLCSYQCRADFFNYSNPENKKTYICKWCGKEFVEWTYRNSVFCSRQCVSEYAAIQPKPKLRRPENFITMKCKVCGKEYSIHKIFLNRKHKNGNMSTSSYCSIECMGIAKSVSMTGENNPQYIDGSTKLNQTRGDNWLSQRRKALKRDFHTCRICGIGYNNLGIYIDVHHIIPYRKFNGDYGEANRLSNLITLCRKCHAAVESGKLQCPEP